jgi:Alpha galactosidase C-terminal beta sandwich domain
LNKPLADGAHSVVLFNANSTPWTDASVSLDALGLDPSQPYISRDLWAQSHTTVTDSIDVGTIPAHGSVIVKVSSAANLLTDQVLLATHLCRPVATAVVTGQLRCYASGVRACPISCAVRSRAPADDPRRGKG